MPGDWGQYPESVALAKLKPHYGVCPRCGGKRSKITFVGICGKCLTASIEKSKRR
jgi:hypothetical protein